MAAFDEAPFVSYLRRCQQSGIDFTTMADVGDTAECRRALYKLNKTCTADIPERGEFYTFEEYLTDRIETPLYDLLRGAEGGGHEDGVGPDMRFDQHGSGDLPATHVMDASGGTIRMWKRPPFTFLPSSSVR